MRRGRGPPSAPACDCIWNSCRRAAVASSAWPVPAAPTTSSVSTVSARPPSRERRSQDSACGAGQEAAAEALEAGLHCRVRCHQAQARRGGGRSSQGHATIRPPHAMAGAHGPPASLCSGGPPERGDSCCLAASAAAASNCCRSEGPLAPVARESALNRCSRSCSRPCCRRCHSCWPSRAAAAGVSVAVGVACGGLSGGACTCACCAASVSAAACAMARCTRYRGTRLPAGPAGRGRLIVEPTGGSGGRCSRGGSGSECCSSLPPVLGPGLPGEATGAPSGRPSMRARTRRS